MALGVVRGLRLKGTKALEFKVLGFIGFREFKVLDFKALGFGGLRDLGFGLSVRPGGLGLKLG